MAVAPYRSVRDTSLVSKHLRYRYSSNVVSYIRTKKKVQGIPLHTLQLILQHDNPRHHASEGIREANTKMGNGDKCPFLYNPELAPLQLLAVPENQREFPRGFRFIQISDKDLNRCVQRWP